MTHSSTGLLDFLFLYNVVLFICLLLCIIKRRLFECVSIILPWLYNTDSREKLVLSALQEVFDFFLFTEKYHTELNNTLHKLDEFMHPVQGHAEVRGGLQPVHFWHLVPRTTAHRRNHRLCLLGISEGYTRKSESTCFTVKAQQESKLHRVENVFVGSQGQKYKSHTKSGEHWDYII